MRTLIHLLLLSPIILFCEIQSISAQAVKGESVEVIQITDMGGDAKGYTLGAPKTACITDHQHTEIRSAVENNKNQIKAIKGNVFEQDLLKMADTYFDFPLQDGTGYPECGYHYVSAYVDHDENPNSAVDFTCGSLSYDAGSYNHQGTDFAVHPYPWHIMENDWVEVIAAAPGIITYKADGNYDQNCSANTSTANMIILEHAGGTETWYAHMKSGTVTSKSIGDFVNAGEVIGIVGSSGNSTGPHMHFEVRDVNDNVIDPFFADTGTSCNTTTLDSWWNDQKPYHDSYINAVKTHSAPPEFSSCNTPATINEQTIFNAGSTVYLGLYIRHQEFGQNYQVTVTRPNGTTMYTYNLVSPSPFLSNAFWYFTINFTENSMLGNYNFQAEYNGQVCSAPFEMVAVGAPIPTVSEWGMLSMSIMFLSMGMILIREEQTETSRSRFSS